MRGHKNTEWRYDKLPSGCWIWCGHIDKGGYPGKVNHRGLVMSAHRAFYEKRFGPIDGGLQVDHLCWTRACVNPEHMRICTSEENNQNKITGKLNAEKVELMRRLHRVIGTPGWALARIFEVSEANVSIVLRRKTWRNVK